MARPKGGYKLEDGTRVPGVTTILSRFKESGGLIHWAWKLGTEGKDYRAERDAAADIGTQVHDLVEAYERKDEGALSVDDAAKAGFEAYLRWRDLTGLVVVEMETSFVSEQYRFGGTIDAIGIDDRGVRAVMDWKTGNPYPEHLIQLGAYAILIEECTGKKVQEGHLCYFGRETGDFIHRSVSETTLRNAQHIFHKMLVLYEDLKGLK